jgi:hypothetical protein
MIKEECFGVKPNGRCSILRDNIVCDAEKCKFYKTREQFRADEKRTAKRLYDKTGLHPREYLEKGCAL